jgi:hypothetical protein
MNDERISRLEKCFWPAGFRRNIWMIVDGARDPRVFPMLLDCHLEYSCLYSGTLPSALEIAAPYLLRLDYEYSDTRLFLQRAWGNNWGVFLKCDGRLDRLRRHLREFLVVRGPDGASLIFRYYDPRVLRVYLPTCTRDELSTLFGPIECFWMEDEKPETVLEFKFNHVHLASKKLALE